MSDPFKNPETPREPMGFFEMVFAVAFGVVGGLFLTAALSVLILGYWWKKQVEPQVNELERTLRHRIEETEQKLAEQATQRKEVAEKLQAEIDRVNKRLSDASEQP